MKAKVWILVALIFLLGFLGLLTLSRGFFVLALPLIAYLGAAILFAPETTRLEVTRTLSDDKVSFGKPVDVHLVVTNQGALLEELYLQDVVVPQLQIEDGHAGKILSLPAGESVELAYTTVGRRGRYRFKALNATVGEHFGLFRRQEQVSAPAQLFVYPKVIKLKKVAIRPRQTHGFAGPIPSRKPGSGTDFYGVREYQLGDALRKVNWRLSARHERSLFTNEFEQEGIADVGLILDAREQIAIHTTKGNLFEYSVQAAASLADAFLTDGHRVALLIYGFGLDRVFPGYGMVQRERILRALAQAQTGVNYVLESLERLPTRFFPAKSQLVIISPLVPDDFGPLVRLGASGYEIMVVSPNPIDFEAVSSPQAPWLEHAVRIANVERSLLLNKLNRAGVRVVDWHVDQRLDAIIHTTLARRPVRRML